MSLQVWLPLINNTKNQGLYNLSTTSYNNSVQQTDGKLGKCYSGQMVYHLSNEFLGNSWSLCAWVKSASWSQYHDIILCKNTTSSDSLQFYFSILNGASLNIGANGGSTFDKVSYTFATNTWYHVAATYDGSKYALYINGEKKKSGTYMSTLLTGMNNLGINCRSMNTAGTTITGDGGKKLNDVRIYDHALSPKEVEEIAKGLVLHYKLDGETQVMVPSGYQQLEYIESTGTSYTDTGYKFNAETDSCKVIMKGNDTNNNGMIFASSSTPYFWLYYYKGANTIGLWVDSGSGQKSVSGVAVDTNKHTLEYKNHQYYIDGVKKGTLAGTHTTTSNNIYLFSYSASTNYPFKGRIYYVDIYRNGIAQRLYVPAKKLSDNTIGLYDVINKTFIQSTSGTAFTAGPNAPVSGPVYDSSGYSNNGTIVGSLTAAASSPRYDVATVFNGSSYTTDTTTLSLSSATQLTVSCWAKPTEANLNNLFGLSYTGYYWQFVSGTNSSLEIRDSSTGLTGSRKSYAWPAVTAGQWVHIVCTYNAGTVKIYKNGELYSTNTTGGTKLNDSINMFDVGNSQSTRFNGQISDFRIYTTALTDGTNNTLDQVKELYTTSMSIDSSGNIHVRELSEL